MFRVLWVLMVVLATGLASAADVVTVRPLRISEHRTFFAKSDKPLDAVNEGLQGMSTVSVLVELSGKPVAKASQFGEISATAKHKGGSLKLVPSMGGVDIAKEYLPVEEQYGAEEKVQDRMLVELEFFAPPREATALTSVEGSLKLLIGDSQEVSVPGVVGKAGKVEHKALEQAGLTVTLIKPTKEQAENPAAAVAFEIVGDQQKLLDMWLEDKDGNPIDASLSSSGEPNGKLTVVFESDEALPKDVKLVLEVIPKLDKIDVPIKLSNLKLP